MTKLNAKEREAYEKIIGDDLQAINHRVIEQINLIWGSARKKLMQDKGWDKLEERKEQLKKQRIEIDEELHQIENTLNSEPLTVQQIMELGGKVDRYDRASGANFYGIPITSQFEYEVCQYIKKNIDVDAPAKFVYDLARSCMRELTMVGTFEDAKKVYEKLYALDFRKYGVDIPPRLHEIKTANPTLSAPKDLLRLEGKKEPNSEKGGE